MTDYPYIYRVLAALAPVEVISCTVEGCERKFTRKVDRASHAAKAHGVTHIDITQAQGSIGG